MYILNSNKRTTKIVAYRNYKPERPHDKYVNKCVICINASHNSTFFPIPKKKKKKNSTFLVVASLLYGYIVVHTDT